MKHTDKIDIKNVNQFLNDGIQLELQKAQKTLSQNAAEERWFSNEKEEKISSIYYSVNQEARRKIGELLTKYLHSLVPDIKIPDQSLLYMIPELVELNNASSKKVKDIDRKTELQNKINKIATVVLKQKMNAELFPLSSSPENAASKSNKNSQAVAIENQEEEIQQIEKTLIHQIQVINDAIDVSINEMKKNIKKGIIPAENERNHAIKIATAISVFVITLATAATIVAGILIACLVPGPGAVVGGAILASSGALIVGITGSCIADAVITFQNGRYPTRPIEALLELNPIKDIEDKARLITQKLELAGTLLKEKSQVAELQI